MKKNYAIKIIMVLAIVAIVGFGVNAFAGWGMGQGPGYHHRGGEDMSYHHRCWGEPEYGPIMGDLSDEELKKLDEQRKTFFEATRDLRYNIYEKKLALKSELAKKAPDAKKASDLQKEISKLKDELGQKRIDHIIKMKKINPYIGKKFFERGRMGHGYGHFSCDSYRQR